MAKGKSRSVNMDLEALEGRRLLSGVHGAHTGTSGQGDPIIVVPLTATPNIVGLFSGTYKSSGGNGPLSVRITGQSSRNVIYGTLTVRNQEHKYEYYKFSGSVHGTSVSFTWPNSPGVTGSITGTLTSSATVLSGKFAVGSEDRGTFTIKR